MMNRESLRITIDLLDATPGNLEFAKQQIGQFVEILAARGGATVLVIEPIGKDDEDDQQDQN